MGECNRSYVAPRLGALLGSQIRLTEVQIEPAVNYDNPAHYTYLTTERKRIASKVTAFGLSLKFVQRIFDTLS